MTGWCLAWSIATSTTQFIENTWLRATLLILETIVFVSPIVLKFWLTIRSRRGQYTRWNDLHKLANWYVREGMPWHSFYVLGIVTMEMDGDDRMYRLAKKQLEAAKVPLDQLPTPTEEKVLDVSQREG